MKNIIYIFLFLSQFLYSQTKVFEFNGLLGSWNEQISQTESTLSSCEFTKQEKGWALLSDGANTKLTTAVNPDLTGNITVEAWIKPYDWGEDDDGHILNNGKLQIYIDGDGAINTLRCTSDDVSTASAATDGISLNVWNHCLVTITSAGVANLYINNSLSGNANQNSGTPTTGTNNIIIGNSNSPVRTFDGLISRVVVYNSILTSAQRTDVYNRYMNAYPLHKAKFNFQYPNTTDTANQASLYDDFKFDAVGSTTPLDWILGTGTYEVKELISDDAVLPQLTTGTKYIECTSAGTIAIQQTEAYGEWESFVYKGAEGNILRYYFNSTGFDLTSYYRIQLFSDEKIYLIKTSSQSLFSTAASYISNNTWYGLGIERTNAGIFTGYIKGGSFGDTRTLIDVSGGAGTNPVTENTYTTSKYWVLDLDVGDRVTLIRKQKGITP